MENEANLFETWGGLRKMARDVQRPASTVHRWKCAGRIPAREMAHVLNVAQSLGLPITATNIIFPLGSGPASAPKASSAIGKPAMLTEGSEARR